MANYPSQNLTYSTHLLDGLDLLYKRTEEVLKSTYEIAEWFKRVAIIQEKFSKSLTKASATNISKGKAGSTTSVEMGTLKCAWFSVRTEMENLANKHLICAQSIHNDIAQRIFLFHADKSNVRKKLVADGVRVSTEYKNSLLVLQKAKANYDVKCKEADTINQSYQKAKCDSNIKPKKLTELSVKATKALDIANQADKEYQKELLRANERQSRFYEIEMPSILEIFQRFEEERIQFLKDIFEKFAILQKDFPSCSKDVFIGVSNAAQIINVKLDIQQFIEQSKTGIIAPPPINYEPFVSDGSVPLSFAVKPVTETRDFLSLGNQENCEEEITPPVINDERVIKLQYQLSELNDIIEGESRNKKGIEKLVKFYSKDANAQEKAKNDLIEQKAKIRKLKDHRTLLEGKLAELCNSLNISPRALDASSQRSPPNLRSPHDLLKSSENVLPDLNITNSANQPNSNNNSNNNNSNSVTVTKKKKRSASDNKIQDSKIVDKRELKQCDDELCDDMIEEVSLLAKALYDYEATSNKELSFKGSDLLTITEQDESGWWFATFKGKRGFVPSNYVKILG